MQAKDEGAQDVAGNNRRLLRRLLLVALAMFGFAVFVMPPLYDVFCELTGLNGKTAATAAVASTQIDTTRTVTVEFLVHTDAALPWRFRRETAAVRVQPGRIVQTAFYVGNDSAAAVTGRAVPSISPSVAAQYLKKTECFCFREQTLQAGEEKKLPLIFYVDPALPRQVTTITLAYTYYNMNKP